jgi:uncharacterized protein YigA (DUF484 family)
VRHSVRQPSYARFRGERAESNRAAGAILNLSEEGMCIQAALPLDLNRILPLSLDLPDGETGIAMSGEVVWLDAKGRAGLRFKSVSEPSRRALERWLSLERDLPLRGGEAAPGGAPPGADDIPPPIAGRAAEGGNFAGENPLTVALEPPNPAAALDFTSILSALKEVQRELAATGRDRDQALQVIAGWALTFTRATGAAIALGEGAEAGSEAQAEEYMICRARAGGDAPPLGTRFQVGSGFSGECVRTRKPLTCDDTDSDPRVDRETCRALGIRSMVAVPLMRGGTPFGLMEVFSSAPRAFHRADHTVLARLADMIAGVLERFGEAESASANAPQPPAPSFGLARPAEEKTALEDEVSAERFVLPLTQLISIAAAFTLFVILLLLIVPWARSRGRLNALRRSMTSTAATSSAATTASALDLETLERKASQGDPDAQYALGSRYAGGEGGKQDYKQAFVWFSKAAEQGNVPAQATLGAYYWAGRGVPQDLTKAYYWATLAQSGGDQGSKYRVAMLASRLSPSEVAAIEQQANDWIRAHPLAKHDSP